MRVVVVAHAAQQAQQSSRNLIASQMERLVIHRRFLGQSQFDSTDRCVVGFVECVGGNHLAFNCGSVFPRHRFCAVTVEMRNGHNTRVRELVITRDRLFA